MMPPRAVFLFSAALCAAGAWAADPLQMEVRNAFDGPLASSSSMVVELSNTGPDARGAVTVTDDNGNTVYPVELPRGARKRILTLPQTQWGEIQFTLETNQGRVVRKASALGTVDESTSYVASIGDDSGNLAFLRMQSGSRQNLRARDAYVTPEGAPDRPTAYKPFSAVFAGTGSERMPDGAVAALRDYVVGGGTLIFVGGASAPVLEDRRWADVLPGSGWTPRTLETSGTLAKMGGVPVGGAYTVLAPSRLTSTVTTTKEGSTILSSERPLGLGRIVVLGFSPFEAPLSAWPGRAKALSGLVRGGASSRGRAFVTNYLGASTPSSYAVYSSGSRFSRPIPSAPRSIENNPFNTKLPPTETVFGILLGYFVLVVPVSFIVLRKLKRGEWAWYTAPILSLGFAGLLFKSAQGLYSASLSTSTQGVLILQQGVPDAMFYGTTQMFFPRGGTYDLKLHGVDSMSPVQDEYQPYGRRESALASFNPVDVGEIVAPSLEANNLSFREVALTQRLDDADWIRIVRKDAHHALVTNRSPYSMTGSLVHDRRMSDALALKPGESKIVDLRRGIAWNDQAALPIEDARNFTEGNRRVAFSGSIQGFRPGPQIGEEVTGQGQIAVLAFGEGLR